MTTLVSGLKKAVKSIIGGRGNVSEARGDAPVGAYDASYAESNIEYRLPYWRSRYHFLWAVIAERIRRDNLRRVLEIGCGPGQLASMLYDNCLIDSYTGLDFSPVGLDIARANCPLGTFILGDARTDSVYDSTSYDVTICTEVLEHVTDDQAIASRFRGRCICTVPNFPYDTHVRHFASEREVTDRYGQFFKQFDVWGMKGQGGQDDAVYFLFDGLK